MQKNKTFNKSSYDIEYSKNNVTRLFIAFNLNNEDDMALLEWTRKRKNYSKYIKELIRLDMNKPQQQEISLPEE